MRGAYAVIEPSARQQGCMGYATIMMLFVDGGAKSLNAACIRCRFVHDVLTSRQLKNVIGYRQIFSWQKISLRDGAAAALLLYYRCEPDESPPSFLDQNTHRGARTHDHKVKSLALCRLS